MTNGEKSFQLAKYATFTWLTVLLVALSILIGGCGTSNEGQSSENQDDSLQVVATFSVLADLVENVAGDEVEVTTLVGPGEDTHTFEATPSDSRALAEADLIFQNGAGFESWLDDLYESSGSEARRITLTEGLSLLRAEEEHHGEEHQEEEHQEEEHQEEEHQEEEHQEEEHHGEEHAGHEDLELDPHVWLDPNNAVIMVGTIRDALVEADPANAETYRSNAAAYIEELEELDAEISERVADIPEENRKLVTGHRVFGYFAERYGFEVPGTAISSLTTESADPSAGEIAELADELEEEGIPAIFPEKSTTERRIMERLAREADVELAPPLFTNALAEEGRGETYIGMMRYNARTIADALGR